MSRWQWLWFIGNGIGCGRWERFFLFIRRLKLAT